MKEMEASTSKTPAEICLEAVNGIPGHARGRAAPKKQILASEKLRGELQNEKQRADSAEERLNAQQEEINKMRTEQCQTNAKLDLLLQKLSQFPGMQLNEDVSIYKLYS